MRTTSSYERVSSDNYETCCVECGLSGAKGNGDSHAMATMSEVC